VAGAPSTRAPARPPAPPPSATSRSRNPFRIRATGEETAKPQAAPSLPPARPAPPPPPDPATKLELLATYVAAAERLAIIWLKQSNPRREDVFRVGGNPLPNAVITAILPRRVELVIDGQQARPLEIEFGPGSGAGGAAAPPPAASIPAFPGAPPPSGLSEAATASSDGEQAVRRLARAEVDSYLDNLPTLLTQVNIQPVFQAGQPAGFRLTDIQKGTILDQIGVQDGDTLRFVNGQRIDSVQSAYQLYNILKESTNVEITVLRNTRPVTLRYLIY
jgi:hypothetical protein